MLKHQWGTRNPIGHLVSPTVDVSTVGRGIQNRAFAAEWNNFDVAAPVGLIDLLNFFLFNFLISYFSSRACSYLVRLEYGSWQFKWSGPGARVYCEFWSQFFDLVYVIQVVSSVNISCGPFATISFLHLSSAFFYNNYYLPLCSVSAFWRINTLNLGVF